MTPWFAASGQIDDPAIVLVHGALDRSAGLLKLGRRLEQRFRVVRYDRRGYGRSTPHLGPFAIEDQVDDLVEVVGLAGCRPPVAVFGHSYGGNVALAAAARHGSLVSAVITYESPLAWLDWWPTSTAGQAAREHSHDPGEAAERFMRRLIGDARWEQLPPATKAARRAEGPAMLAELADIRRRPPWSSGDVAVPVLAMHGERSLDHHRHAMQLVAEWFASAPVEVVGARHFGPNSHPDAVADAVEQFLSGVSSASVE